MHILQVGLSALGSVAAMFAITKALGNRQLSQLSLFDYVTGITLGSIGAELAIAGDKFAAPLLAAGVYGAAALAIALSTGKSMALRRLFNGRPVVLYQNGKLYDKNFSIAKMDIHEFLVQCRTAGYFDLADVALAILEPNGTVSFLPTDRARPATAADVAAPPAPAGPAFNVIADGKIQEENLRRAGKNRNWLLERLHGAGVGRPSEVFLAVCTPAGELQVYRKTGLTKEKRLGE